MPTFLFSGSQTLQVVYVIHLLGYHIFHMQVICTVKEKCNVNSIGSAVLPIWQHCYVKVLRSAIVVLLLGGKYDSVYSNCAKEGNLPFTEQLPDIATSKDTCLQGLHTLKHNPAFANIWKSVSTWEPIK